MIEKHWQAVESRTAQPLAKAFGGSLLEFCWQHAVMATLLPAARLALWGQLRIVCCGRACAALAAMASCATGTFLWISIASKSYAVEKPPASAPSSPDGVRVVAAFQEQHDGNNKQ